VEIRPIFLSANQRSVQHCEVSSSVVHNVLGCCCFLRGNRSVRLLRCVWITTFLPTPRCTSMCDVQFIDMQSVVSNDFHGEYSFFTTQYTQFTQLTKKCSVCYGTRMFLAVFTREHHRFLSWAGWIQSTPANHFPKTNFNIVLPFIPSGLLPSGFLL
jgi:hypothetical protein